ncbi:MAG: flavodoxin-dependent (E)-4-hydroxy-3-methylbut-2-enyl-diphosphate synthase, partial [Phycisphaerae bacterium]|nr:flavodoxin-dependent (E)-4-hydroxy-3-methylbut-2-enyl-diphosphate synthase [Phycisphaerae bacterium]
MKLPEIQRRKTRSVTVGDVRIGGDSPVSIQSMTTTPTSDVAATLRQIEALAAA